MCNPIIISIIHKMYLISVHNCTVSGRFIGFPRRVIKFRDFYVIKSIP